MRKSLKIKWKETKIHKWLQEQMLDLEDKEIGHSNYSSWKVNTSQNMCKNIERTNRAKLSDAKTDLTLDIMAQEVPGKWHKTTNAQTGS